MSEKSTEVQTFASSHLINSVLITMIAGGIAWVLLELHHGRERWARVEERISSQSTHIVEMRVDLNTNLTEWRSAHEKNTMRVFELERKIAVQESRLDRIEVVIHASKNQ